MTIAPAALQLAYRLATAIMTLVRAVAPIATASSTPTLPEAAAQTLFFRLSRLVTHLIRISNFGVRVPTNAIPNTRIPEHPAPIAPPRSPRPVRTASLPRRPGWLLAALPETAPAVAADVSTLLADPAIATLLDAAPSLHRILRPLLRSLGLSPHRPTPPAPPLPGLQHPAPAAWSPSASPTSNPPIPANPSKLASSKPIFTPTSLR